MSSSNRCWRGSAHRCSLSASGFTLSSAYRGPTSSTRATVHEVLWDTIHRLFEKRIVLDFTDHLTDYELYCLIYRDILPAHEKKIDRSTNYLHWDCAGTDRDPETWLRYYATEEERESWADDLEIPLPPHADPPHARRLPKAPL